MSTIVTLYKRQGIMVFYLEDPLGVRAWLLELSPSTYREFGGKVEFDDEADAVAFKLRFKL